MDTTISERPATQVNRLREIRMERGLTMKQIADAAGVSYQHIYKAERRTDSLAMSKWIRIAAFLETPLHDLV